MPDVYSTEPARDVVQDSPQSVLVNFAKITDDLRFDVDQIIAHLGHDIIEPQFSNRRVARALSWS